MTAGKIANTYRESSRWLTVRNESEYNIEPYAPFAIFRSPALERQGEKKISSGVLSARPYLTFEENPPAASNAEWVASDVWYAHMLINGPATIYGTKDATNERDRYGQGTQDWPALTVIGHNSRTIKNFSSSLLFPDLTTDTATAYRFNFLPGRSSWTRGAQEGALQNDQNNLPHVAIWDSRVVKVLQYDEPNAKEGMAWVTGGLADPGTNVVLPIDVAQTVFSSSGEIGLTGSAVGAWNVVNTAETSTSANEIQVIDNTIVFFYPGAYKVDVTLNMYAGDMSSAGIPQTMTPAETLGVSDVFVALEESSDYTDHGFVSIQRDSPTGNLHIRETLAATITGLDLSGGYDEHKLANRGTMRTVHMSVLVQVNLKPGESSRQGQALAGLKLNYTSTGGIDSGVYSGFGQVRGLWMGDLEVEEES